MKLFLLAVSLLLTFAAPAGAATKPTIVLVHGAFADASGWDGVTERLQDRGYTVLAPPNPLRGVSSDAAYIKSFLAQTPGPIVLVGHSYGGVVITNAATGNPNVKVLVYVAAFAPAQGDTVQALTGLAPGSMLAPAALDIRGYPLPDGTTGQEASIKPSAFREIFAADLPKKQAAVLAASQRPASLITLGEPSGPPAWANIPSYFLIPTKDNTIGTANLRIMAKRAKAKTVEVKASHCAYVSHPKETAKLIEDAAQHAPVSQ